MPLTPGTRLGVYEVTAQIGEGGMGEVYRATDTTLGRQVAIKILPDAFASDPERMARFEREAKTLASLNHPNIASIYAVEKSADLHALVMELVEGDDLSQRIARGAIPLDEALPIAKQIAEALEAAHEQGIVHRDLKPANIKVRADGTAKVLDFGLAKAMEPAAGSSVSNSMSPTITTPAQMTGVGMILGTAAYMSPEQAKGRPADKRSDVWAFGCVFYEMLTGKRAFDGEDIADTLANVLKSEPNWTPLAGVPGHIQLLIRRCLEKDRQARISDVGVVRFLMTDPVVPSAFASRGTGTRRSHSPAFVFGAAGLAIGIALATAASWIAFRPPQEAPRPVRFKVVPSATYPMRGGGERFALSPDGTTLVYVSQLGANVRDQGLDYFDGQLMIRPISDVEAVPIRGVVGREPFFSPDGKWIGYFVKQQLQKVSVAGGPPVTVCNISRGARGASWGSDNTIVFTTTLPGNGLLRVSAGGGEPKVVTTPDKARGEVFHLYPSFLPARNAVLFTVVSGTAAAPRTEVDVVDLRTQQRKTLVDGGAPSMYLSSGHLVYGVRGTVFAVPFDVKNLAVTGDPVPVLDSVATFPGNPLEVTMFWAAQTGALAYLASGSRDAVTTPRSLVWVDRHGHEEPTGAPSRTFASVRLSPDGTAAAVSIGDRQRSDVWIWEFSRKMLRRLTFDPSPSILPLWTPDGRRIIFTSSRSGANNIYWQAADGTGTVERLTTSANGQAAHAMSPDGKTLILQENNPSIDIRFLRMDEAISKAGQATSEPLIQTPALEAGGEVSPNGRWLAYFSNESGQAQVHVRPFPNVEGGRWQVSTDGGSEPLWSSSGRELFYLDSDGNLIAVPVQIGPSFSMGNPVKIVEGDWHVEAPPVRHYDVSRDGQRFLMIKEERASEKALPSTSINIVLNWGEELKQRVPAK